MSYFAKPNFIIYDEWFDDDYLKKNKLDIKNRKIKSISTIHEFFYEQSNKKVGASENNLQFDIKVNEKEFFTNNYLEKKSEKYNPFSKGKILIFKKIPLNKFKYKIEKKIIISLLTSGFAFIFGLQLFFISQSKKSESSILNKSFALEKSV